MTEPRRIETGDPAVGGHPEGILIQKRIRGAIIRASRYHDFSAGHRVAGHENKCAFLHGHNYRVHFHCEAQALDSVGRVIDFSVIKARLCNWLEENWDHKFLAWENDLVLTGMVSLAQRLPEGEHRGEPWAVVKELFAGSIVWTPFNPTAENMAQYLVEKIAPVQLEGTGVTLVKCVVEETRKCSAEFHAERYQAIHSY
jgi:6-pyruvoyltetrahydropterin/6-carboxytetrahydropterin synthase